MKGLPSVAGKGRLIYIFQRYRQSSAACSPVRLIGMQKYFRKHIRYFNSHFSFTSFGVSIDHNLASARGTGVYCFKAHSQIYHRLDQLIPGGRGPRHMQLYFYDTNETIAHRVKGLLSLILQ